MKACTHVHTINSIQRLPTPITSLQPSKLHLDIGYVLPTDTGSLCLAVDSTHTAVGLFQLLVRRSGTHCQMNSEILRVMSKASNSSLKQCHSGFSSVTSTLEVNFKVMHSRNSRFTYLLTYLPHCLDLDSSCIHVDTLDHTPMPTMSAKNFHLCFLRARSLMSLLTAPPVRLWSTWSSPVSLYLPLQCLLWYSRHMSKPAKSSSPQYVVHGLLSSYSSDLYTFVILSFQEMPSTLLCQLR